jgi:hypothetical protein
MSEQRKVERVVVYYSDGRPGRVALRLDDDSEIVLPRVVEVVETINNARSPSLTTVSFRVPVEKVGA